MQIFTQEVRTPRHPLGNPPHSSFGRPAIFHAGILRMHWISQQHVEHKIPIAIKDTQPRCHICNH
jgi:hypothetical protein